MATERGEEQGMVRSVARFVFAHAAVAPIMLVVLEEQNAEHFCQCMEACPLLSLVELCNTLLFHNIAHMTMTLCGVAQVLAATLALVAAGWRSQAASSVALCFSVGTGMLPTRLIYTALFGSHCCFSGGLVQVAFAVAVVVGQLAISFWGTMAAAKLARAPLP